MLFRIIAIIFIFACSAAAWVVLFQVNHVRSGDSNYAMAVDVQQLWGTEHAQQAPRVDINWMEVEEREPTLDEMKERQRAQPKGRAADAWIADVNEPVRSKKHHEQPLGLASSNVDVTLDVEHRRKGLLWFATYTVDFDAVYTIDNPVDQPVNAIVKFQFPSPSAVYDNMVMTAPGRDDLEITAEGGMLVGRFELPAGETQQMHVGYQSRGLDRWSYAFGEDVNLVEDLRLVMGTNFDAIDFPLGSISPDSKTPHSGEPGWELEWDKDSLVSGSYIGMLMPHRINPGPLAAAMSIHAPVSLFFFFFVLFILQVLRGIKIHPMNYFFLAASFFAFNLLFSYLVDHVDILVSFGIASATSVFLVVSYLRLVVGVKFAVLQAGFAQIVYQILFSLAHFFEGYTGLTVTIGAIVTLAVVMHLTAKVDWDNVFTATRRPAHRRPAPAAD